MLELRPHCEHCARALPADSTAAMICSFECTFCKPCVDNVLFNVCPNCGGGFTARPIRPKNNWKNNNCLTHFPASTTTHHQPVKKNDHHAFAESIRLIPPERR